MSIKDFFNGKTYRKQLDSLEKENAELKICAAREKQLENQNALLQNIIDEQSSVLTDEHHHAIDIKRHSGYRL